MIVMDTNSFNTIFFGSNAPFRLTQSGGNYLLSCNYMLSGPKMVFYLNSVPFTLRRKFLKDINQIAIDYILSDGRTCFLGIQPSNLFLLLNSSESHLCESNDVDSGWPFFTKILYNLRLFE